MNLSSYFINHHAHGAFFATVFLIAGILCAFLNFLPLTLGAITLIALIPNIATYFWTSNFDPKGIILPLCFITGAALYTQQITNHYRFQEAYTDKAITVNGTVASLEKLTGPRHRWCMIVDLQFIKTAEATVSAHQTVAVYTVKNPNVMVGDRIEINNLLIKKIENNSFNLFLAKEKISATIFIDTPQITLKSRPSFSLSRYASQLRNKILYGAQHTMDKQTFALFCSIFLGNKAAAKQEMDYAKEPFKVWGISHYLARSGLHLLIFGMVWHYLLGFIPILYLGKQIFLLLLILCYAALSWSSVSFNRALIMFLVAKFCLFHKIRLHYVHLICLATCIVLISNPLQLLYLDFQLSFGLTFALAWFAHIETHKKAASGNLL